MTLTQDGISIAIDVPAQSPRVEAARVEDDERSNDPNFHI